MLMTINSCLAHISLFWHRPDFYLGNIQDGFYFYIGLEASRKLADHPIDFHYTIFSVINILMVFSCIALTFLKRYQKSEENELIDDSITYEMDYVFGIMTVCWVLFYVSIFVSFQYYINGNHKSSKPTLFIPNIHITFALYPSNMDCFTFLKIKKFYDENSKK